MIVQTPSDSNFDNTKWSFCNDPSIIGWQVLKNIAKIVNLFDKTQVMGKRKIEGAQSSRKIRKKNEMSLLSAADDVVTMIFRFCSASELYYTIPKVCMTFRTILKKRYYDEGDDNNFVHSITCSLENSLWKELYSKKCQIVNTIDHDYRYSYKKLYYHNIMIDMPLYVVSDNTTTALNHAYNSLQTQLLHSQSAKSMRDAVNHFVEQVERVGDDLNTIANVHNHPRDDLFTDFYATFYGKENLIRCISTLTKVTFYNHDDVKLRIASPFNSNSALIESKGEKRTIELYNDATDQCSDPLCSTESGDFHEHALWTLICFLEFDKLAGVSTKERLQLLKKFIIYLYVLLSSLNSNHSYAALVRINPNAKTVETRVTEFDLYSKRKKKAKIVKY
ncbi:hypothetical protein AKO1_000713 [Acrasis kona]|uniref:F-box protein n=1 Tax=Acrasis kona TaxID=1008807 RepID=A0AAW2ZEQ5_9EUKA